MLSTAHISHIDGNTLTLQFFLEPLTNLSEAVGSGEPSAISDAVAPNLLTVETSSNEVGVKRCHA